MSYLTSWSELHGVYSYDNNYDKYYYYDDDDDDDMDRVLCGEEKVN
jgi:hypothetical protein